MKTSTAVAEAIAAEGVDVLFGLLGGGNEELVADLTGRHGVRFVATRNEQGAVAMADGYSRATGRLGVASISHGPGLANAGTALTAARLARSSLLVVTSDTGAGQRLNPMNFNQPPFALATAGAVQQIDSPGSLLEDVESALRHVHSGAGPIVLNFPQHVIDAEMPAGWTSRSTGLRQVPWQAVHPGADAIATAVDMIAASRRPVILAGRGAVRAGARELLRDLASRAGALLTTTLLAKDWFQGNAYNLGITGGFGAPAAMEILKEADLILAFGTMLSYYTTEHGSLLANARVIQVDQDPRAIGHVLPVDHAVIGDVRAAAEAMLAALRDRHPGGWRSPEMAARIARIDPWEGIDFAATEGFVNPHTAVKLAEELLPPERQLVVDVGSHLGFSAPHFSVQDPRDLLFPWHFGAVGIGVLEAIGAAVGRPDHLTVLFTGDGGLMMYLSDLETAARCGIPLLVFVLNDGGFGGDRQRYERIGLDPALVSYANPDFAVVARALGLRSYQADSAEALGNILRELGPVKIPTLIDVRVDPHAAHPEIDRAMRSFAMPGLVPESALSFGDH